MPAIGPNIPGTLQVKRLSDKTPWLVLVISLVLTGVGLWIAFRSQREQDRLRFRIAADVVQQRMVDKLDSYVGVVWAEAALFQANDLQVDKAQFRKFRLAADWGGRIEGLAGLSFVQRVEWRNIEAFEEKMRRSEPAFPNLAKPPDGEDLYVVTHLETLAGQTTRALGYNSMLEPVRRAALQRAARTGRASSTDLVILQSDELSGVNTPAILLFAPVYHPGAELLPREEREGLIYGFTSASFRVKSLVEHMLGGTQNTPLGSRISLVSENSADTVLADTGDFEAGQLIDERRVAVAGRKLDLKFWTLPQFASLRPHAHLLPLVGLSGGLLSLTLFALSLVQVREKKARESALMAEKQRAKDLEEMGKAKTVFFSNLNHELRTPLNGILGMSDLLYDTDLDEVQKEYLHSIASCGKSLMDLISDVLDLSKVRAGKMELRPGPCKLKNVFEQAIHVVTGPAKGKGVELVLDWSDDVPELVELDEMRLRQVLVNLLGNAVKFTDSGQVTLRARLHTDSGDLCFEVQDTGIGISSENVSLLFKPFSQVLSSDSHSDQKGTGLGLHLCREILELMGGTIWVESELGVGSTFKGRIPITELESDPYATQTVPVEQSLFSQLNIMVVDDNPVNRRVLALQLEKMGNQVAVAESGYRALEELEHKTFDLILMDYQMPGMDGLETTRKSRELKGDEPIIVALTAFTEDEKREACKQAGMNAFLTKPVDVTKLRDLVSSVLSE